MGNSGKRGESLNWQREKPCPAPEERCLRGGLRYDGFSGEPIFVLRDSPGAVRRSCISAGRLWGATGSGEQAGILLCQVRAPSGLSGAFFTRRDTHTLPFIWAGPLTSTEKGFFQACLAANCWVDWRAAQMKETRQNAAPSPRSGRWAASRRPQAPAPARLPLPPEA